MNVIKKSTKQKTTRFICYNPVWLLLGVFFCCNCTNNDYKTYHPQLIEAEHILWNQKGDSCLHFLANIDTMSMSTFDKNVWLLYQEHAYIRSRTYKNRPPTLVADKLISYFKGHHAVSYTGHAYYIRGAEYYLISDAPDSAMFCFKNAEYYTLQSPKPSAYLLGTLYSQMGLTFRTHGNQQEIYEHCKKAIPYQLQTFRYINAAATYNRMASVYPDTLQKDNILALYDSAIYYNQLGGKTVEYYIYQYNKAVCANNSEQMYNFGKYIVDSLHNKITAITLVEHYIRKQQADSARYYLDIFAADTLSTNNNNRWSKEKYHWGEASCLLLEGNTEEAAEKFRKLYYDVSNNSKTTNDKRTDLISRKYDVEKAQREQLELEVEKQRLWLSLLLTIGGIALLVLLFFVYREYTRIKHAQLAARNTIQAQRIEALNQELTIKRDSLKKNLLQRIELTRQLHLQQMKTGKQEKTEELPIWAQEFIKSQLLINEEISQTLYQEFNTLYYNMLNELHADYPRLTHKDLLMCILITLQLPISDVCMLFGVPKQTVWNRRNLIKERIGLSHKDNVQAWLHDYALQLAMQEEHNRS